MSDTSGTPRIPDPLEADTGTVIDYSLTSGYDDMTLDEHADYVEFLKGIYLTADAALNARKIDELNAIDEEEEYYNYHAYDEADYDDYPGPNLDMRPLPGDAPPGWEP